MANKVKSNKIGGALAEEPVQNQVKWGKIRKNTFQSKLFVINSWFKCLIIGYKANL